MELNCAIFLSCSLNPSPRSFDTHLSTISRVEPLPARQMPRHTKTFSISTPAHSPAMMGSASPTMMAPPSMADEMANNNMPNSMSNLKSAAMMSMNSAPMAYIPPLCDGACGTVPRSQQPMWAMMRQEMMCMMRMMPNMCWAMLTQRNHMSWADMGDTTMHMLLTCMEMCMMVMAVPVWMMLPGAMFAMWIGCCAMMVMAMCWMMNGKEQMHMCNMDSSSEGWMTGQDMENEKWIFMGGMGMRYDINSL